MGVRGLALGGAALALALALVPAAAADDFTAVQANVGNANVPGCQGQVFKLCQVPVERRAGGALRALRADLVGFEQVLPPELCLRSPSANPDNLCSGPLDPPSQVSRLLGGSPAQACASRSHSDCLALASSALRLERLATRPTQPGCSDSGLTLSTGTVRLRGWPITVALVRASSTDAACRTRQLRDLFSSLPAGGPTLILGDFGLDPFRDDDESVREWRNWVPSRFSLLGDGTVTFVPCGTSQLDPSGNSLDGPLPTCLTPQKALDHVLARGLSGRCEVRRLDGGGGMEHRAQVCRIHTGPEVTPVVRIRPKRCTVGVRLSPSPAYLTGVRFRLGKSFVTDRKAPFQLRRSGRRRRRAGRLVVRPLLANGEGPRVNRRLRACARRRR
jgi:hypothetical protein